MNKKEQLTKLFSEWESTDLHRDGIFIRDGAVDIDLWEKANRKVLFLAKEAYGFYEDKDLCDEIIEVWTERPKYKMWRTMSYWAYGLQNSTPKIIPPLPDHKSKVELISEALFSSAIVNIKKSHGESHSHDEDTVKYLEADSDLLSKEIEILNPDIVVCCSTFHLVSGYLWPKTETSELKVYRQDKKWIIDFWHPSNRYPNILNYYTLCALAQQARIFG